MGAFDDLVPVSTSGAFDDLVPKDPMAGPQVKTYPLPPGTTVPIAPQRTGPSYWQFLNTPIKPLVAVNDAISAGPLLLNEAAKRLPAGTAKGVVEGAKSLVDTGLSPLSLATLGLAKYAPLLSKPAALAFSAYQASQVPGQASALGTAMGQPESDQRRQEVSKLLTEGVGGLGMGGLAAVHGLSIVPDVANAYNLAKESSPGTSTIGDRAPNDIVVDALQPVAARVPEVTGDQGVAAPAVRLSPGQPYAPGAFDDLVPKETVKQATTRENVEPVNGGITPSVPLNPGGAVSELPPELAAQSAANNSRAAFEALAKAQGTTLPTAEPPSVAEEVIPNGQEKEVQDGEKGTVLEPKGNLMNKEAAGLRHDLLPLVDEGQRKQIAKYYTDTGDLAGATKQANDAWRKQIGKPEEPAKASPVPEMDSTIGAGIRAALAKNEGSESGFVNLQPVKDLYDKLVGSIRTSGPKAEFLVDRDAADTAGDLASSQAGEGLRTMAHGLFGGQYARTPGGKQLRITTNADLALEATTAAVEANGDRNKLQTFMNQARAAGDDVARSIAEFAYVNWDRLQPLVQRVNQLHEIEFQREVAAGSNIDKREAYIEHAIDPDKLVGAKSNSFSTSGSGGRGFTKMRYVDTYFDHVENGNSKAIKTWNAADLAENRLKRGLRMVNDVAVIEGMKNRVDPTTGRPIIRSMDTQVNPTTGTKHQVAPQGYVAWSPYSGRSFAVHKGYENFMNSVSALSWIRSRELAGLPMGDWLMKTKGGIKHSMLLFDTFHAVRMFVKGMSFGVLGRHSRALLEYSDQDLNQAVANGEIPQRMADFARTNRGDFNRLVKNGLNIGQVSEGLDSQFWKEVPLAGDFNKWVFQKMTRSIMAESALAEFRRQSKANPGMRPDAVARMVARDMNINFGNLGRQGFFKSKTMQDLTSLAFLAPQWFESMAKTEAFAMGQTAKIPLTGKVGSLARGSGTLLAAFVALTQIGNLITKGQPTWKNKENDSKLEAMDMWVPDISGQTKGFRFSPLAVPFELTHDAIRYAASGKDRDEVITQILANKASPLARAAVTYGMGQDYSGAKLRGNDRLAEAGKALIPLPLPLRSALNPNSSLQRQLTASVGLKMEPIKATKAEIASGDVPLESKTLAARKLLERQLKTTKEPQSLSDRRVMLERGAQSEATRNEAVFSGLPKPAQKWLTDKGLQLPSYQDTLQMGSTRLSLTKREEDFLQEKVVSEYTRVVSGLMENPTFESLSRQQQQNRLNNLMTQARGRVRVALRKQMASQRLLLSGSLQP